MQKILIPVGLAVGIGAGWLIYAGAYAERYASRPIELAPIVHAKYDPTKIEREIALHESRVTNDPEGAIGFAILSGAYLAKSREQDDDASSWKAEEAARTSLAIRRRGNIQGAMKLVQAMLEQHRFQDSLKAVDDALRVSPGDDQAKLLRADVLIELGRNEDARKQLEQVEIKDPTFMAVKARWQSANGDHLGSLATWKRAVQDLEKMSHIGEEFIAWYQVKAGSELLKLGKPSDARILYETAFAMAPRSYKASLGIAEAAFADGKWKEAVISCDKTLAMVNSFRAMAVRGRALEKMGDLNGAKSQFAKMHEAFLEEDSRYSKMGKGGPLGVRHPDREFATFCAESGMFPVDGLRAAKRDILNRPDELAKSNLAKLQQTISG
ncbi:MAG: tetratricopeptide repeat protein [Chlorobia bacterium]|nr:tetratricopeptide repeat protein [Fimbriimonadaceae bacterium]